MGIVMPMHLGNVLFFIFILILVFVSIYIVSRFLR